MQLDTELIYREVREPITRAEQIRLNVRLPALFSLSIISLVGVTAILQMIYYEYAEGSPVLSQGWSIAVFVASFIALFGLGYYFFHPIEKIFKNEIVPKIVSFIGKDFTYKVDKEIDETIIKASRLFKKYHQYGGDHLVSGQIDNQLLEFSSIRMKTRPARTESEGSSGRRQKTLFKGAMIHLQLKSKLPSPFWIIPKKGVFAWRFPYLKKVENGQFVDIPGLNDKYEVYTSEPTFTKQLLTEHIVNTINQIHADFLDQKITERPLLFAFFEDHICIAFSKKTSVFSMPVFPIFYKLDRVEFIDRQLLIVNAALSLKEKF